MRRKQTLILIAALLVVSIGVAAAYHHFNVTHAQKQSGKVANVQDEKGANTSKSSVGSSSQVQGGTKDIAGNQPASSASGPLLPSGNFVSNHHPGQNGSGTTEQSVCDTTPGASCNIVFTSSSGIKKEMGSKTTDANGAAIWNWDINGSNIAPGTWTITATATLNGKTATTTDAIKLEVQ